MKDAPTINAIAAITNDGELIWAKGIEDSNTTVQAYVPYKYFSKREQAEMEESKEEWPDQEAQIYIAECEVYHLTKQYDNFKITTIEVPLNLDAITQ